MDVLEARLLITGGQGAASVTRSVTRHPVRTRAALGARPRVDARDARVTWTVDVAVQATTPVTRPVTAEAFFRHGHRRSERSGNSR